MKGGDTCWIVDEYGCREATISAAVNSGSEFYVVEVEAQLAYAARMDAALERWAGAHAKMKDQRDKALVRAAELRV